MGKFLTLAWQCHELGVPKERFDAKKEASILEYGSDYDALEAYTEVPCYFSCVCETREIAEDYIQSVIDADFDELILLGESDNCPAYGLPVEEEECEEYN